MSTTASRRNWSRPPSGPPSRIWSRRSRPGRPSPSRARNDPMAVVPIKVPKVSESISEGILASWLKPDGSFVKAGEPLYELETDKASQVFISPGAGTLKIQAKEGDTVQVESVIGTIDPDAVPSVAPTRTAEPKQATTPPPKAVVEQPSQAAAAESSNGGVATMPLAPSVRRIVAESNIDPAGIEGTGRGGRLTKGDVLAHVQAPASAPSPEPVPSIPTTSGP